MNLNYYYKILTFAQFSYQSAKKLQNLDKKGFSASILSLFFFCTISLGQTVLPTRTRTGLSQPAVQKI